jgi:hypothetical protein
MQPSLRFRPLRPAVAADGPTTLDLLITVSAPPLPPELQARPRPPLNLPAGLVERVQRQPADGAPALDPTKPETDHQLQQALQLVRGMVAAPNPQRRAGR